MSGDITIPCSWITLGNVHDYDDGCKDACVIHNPTDHHMRHWHLHWRSDRGIFERICPHGTGHPDPDQYGYWKRTNQDHQSVHGCDGCCCPPGVIVPEELKCPTTT